MKYEVFRYGVKYKHLKGTPCDPEESISVACINTKTKRQYDQNFKRITLMKKSCLYMGIDGKVWRGLIGGFYEDGRPHIIPLPNLKCIKCGSSELVLMSDESDLLHFTCTDCKEKFRAETGVPDYDNLQMVILT